ncbi:MAG: hypothetical protein KatS3mg031_1263 [Chitinophagales bacterium]|nr:MAG: hypothetical protein KatS3mg031_1263 [Chitinophagales bacterium]
MPVYNAAAYVAEAVQSILDQTFSDFELLIIDDGSTDPSLQVIQAFNDSRIRLIRNETNLKLIATLNKGLEHARGKYIARMDADDVSTPERLAVQVAFMEKNPEVGVCGSWFETFGNGKKIVRYPEKDADIRLMLLYQTPFCHPAVLFRKALFDQYHTRFNPEFVHAEDYEVWVRLADKTRFANIPRVLLRYRIHPGSVSSTHTFVQQRNTLSIIRQAFQKAGTTVNEEEIALFRDVAYSHFRSDTEFILAAERLLLRLIAGNQKTHFIPEQTLIQFATGKWYHLCYNSLPANRGAWHIYRKSGLYRMGEKKLLPELKFLVKTLFPKN